MRDLLDKIAGILAEADEEPLSLPSGSPDIRSDLAKAEKIFFQVADVIESTTGVPTPRRKYDRDDPNDLIDIRVWEIPRGYSDFEASGVILRAPREQKGAILSPEQALAAVAGVMNQTGSFKIIKQSTFVPLGDKDKKLWKGTQQLSFTSRLRLPTVMVEVYGNSCDYWTPQSNRVLPGIRVGQIELGRQPTAKFKISMTRLASWGEDAKAPVFDVEKDRGAAKKLYDQIVSKATKVVGRPPSRIDGPGYYGQRTKAVWEIDIDLVDLKPFSRFERAKQSAPKHMIGVGLRPADARAKVDAMEDGLSEMPTLQRSIGNRDYEEFDVDNLYFRKKARWPAAAVEIMCQAWSGGFIRTNLLDQGTTFQEAPKMKIEVSVSDIDPYGTYDNLETSR